MKSNQWFEGHRREREKWSNAGLAATSPAEYDLVPDFLTAKGRLFICLGRRAAGGN